MMRAAAGAYGACDTTGISYLVSRSIASATVPGSCYHYRPHCTGEASRARGGEVVAHPELGAGELQSWGLSLGG